MIILGIHDGHNASASLIVDGKLVCALAEERLSRSKHHYGYPDRAIQSVLETAGITTKNIDRISMSTKTLPPAYFYTRRNSTFSIKDYWKEQIEYWYPKLYEGKNPKYMEIFADRIDLNHFPYDKSFIKDERLSVCTSSFAIVTLIFGFSSSSLSFAELTLSSPKSEVR